MTERIQLRPGVRWREMLDGEYIAFVPGDGSPVRITKNVANLLSLLELGADRGQIAENLTEYHGRAISTRQSEQVIAALRKNQMLNEPKVQPGKDILWIADIGAMVQKLGLDRVSYAIGALYLGLVALALYAIVQLVASGQLKNPMSLFFEMNWFPFALLILAIPLHELGHILAGIASNTSLGRVGVRKRSLPIIKPFVESFSRKDGKDALPLAITAAGGPLSDIINAGLAASVALAGPDWLQPTASGFCALALLMAYQNLSIARRKDGYTILAKTCQALGVKTDARTGLPFGRSTSLTIRALHLLGLVCLLGFLLLIAVPEEWWP